jgi:hypothetical protein
MTGEPENRRHIVRLATCCDPMDASPILSGSGFFFGGALCRMH